MPSSSRASQLKSQWITALKLITVANGYNYTLTNSVGGAIVAPELIPWAGINAYVAVELGPSKIKAIDTGWLTYDEIVDVYIVGFVKSDTETATALTASKLQDAMEQLITDLETKIYSDLLTVNINNTSTNAWNVRASEVTFERSSLLGSPRNIGIVQTTLQAKIRHQDSYFISAIFTEADAMLQAESGSPIEMESYS